MSLFQLGGFVAASGQQLDWKIECDALDPGDWACLAHILNARLPVPFGEVVGVPRGGVRFAEALDRYVTPGCLGILVVDDVWTTGGSMARFVAAFIKHRQLAPQRLHRAVAFARGELEPDVVAVFQ